MSEGEVRIAVLGSVNLDLVASVPRFPEAGETLSGATVKHHPGGKGANQALAARRLGAEVSLVACLGTDPAADEALAQLREEQVQLDSCNFLADHPTGLALILVNAEGENQIVVAPGANAAFTPDLMNLPSCDALIAQLEVPLPTIATAANHHQGFFALNAAPARPVDPQLLARVDLLIVNELEAATLGGNLGKYRGLLAKTLGGRGAILYRDGEEIARSEPPRVEVVDTTGAGDAFTAALTVALMEGESAESALDIACLSAAISVTRAGAQSAPTRDEVNAWRSPAAR